ncbi:Protein RTA1 [Cytospora mali]|uniref:Protein RTA1 n=1 Tax=Cytospora mali TaxID=578113 RepID=A0A194VMC5_CYTMA|nr:Protein RTA1 [Valsa mali]
MSLLERAASFHGDVKNWYSYDPVTGVAIAACACFAVGLLVHLWQMIRHKAWIWCIMVIAVAMECFGYGIRIASTHDVASKQKFVAQYVLIVLAPVLMTGIIYVTFGRIVFHVVPAESRTTKLLWAPPRWITPIFVGCDIVSLLLQLVGAVMIAGTSPTDANAIDKLHHGKDIALTGVTVQIVGFGLFSVIAARFHFTSRRFKVDLEKRLQPVPGEKTVTVPGLENRKFRPQWEVLLYVVNISCALILVRSIYREIEFGEGKTGYSNTHEWVQYCFDTIPMVLLVVLYAFFPPGRYVQMSFKQTKGAAQARSSQSSDVEAAHVQAEV